MYTDGTCPHCLQVSFFSTSPELSNKQRFEYFFRTIPSDHYQVKAMVEMVQRFHWSYISILYEESNYGIKVGHCPKYIDHWPSFSFLQYTWWRCFSVWALLGDLIK
ncbi:hypothetical protein PR048_019933 [Dryococelus australis]|uniref:Receptor ligand binding region domain-containing protein n=1 Tax=Dryococelus australis TaxID=614101 RepID=A0ABQ9H502_9NEOP|nr:hypothetical protein PR048_019933 [Dryococelus australis]